MDGRKVAAGLAVLIAMAMFGKARAQEAQLKCGTIDEAETVVMGKYGEVPQADALIGTPAGMLPVRLYANAKTGTWTMLAITPNGAACMVAIGSGWKPSSKPGRSI